MKYSLLLLLSFLQLLSYCQHTIVSIDGNYGTSDHIYSNNTPAHSRPGAYYSVNAGTMDRALSFTLGAGALFTGTDLGYTKITTQQIMLPFIVTLSPDAGNVKPFAKAAIVPSYIFKTEMDKFQENAIEKAYQDNINQWNFSVNGKASHSLHDPLRVQISKPK